MLILLWKSHGLRKDIQLLRRVNNKWPWFIPSSTPLASKSDAYKNPCGDGSDRSGKAKHQISYKTYEPLVYTCHDAKNMKLNRPMSPHLTIYAPTLPAMTSIVQRVTGLIVTAYAVLMAFGSLFLSNGVETYVSIIQSLDLSRPSIFVIKMILGAPFVYHYFNGIRFCMWNAGKWLDMKEVYSTARTSFIATAVVTVLFTLL
ncbi:succinate dehydrogenase cytochrome b560 subunit, mitochondrial-like [Maniola hyperantus]|uniref:succinate dehydrogenase cytochrome b560 subunit, mitochondrial-like n=1 Tax=Aphantopus hyperantus TaxID=2795564 RepID=UPI00156A4D61|nr:succinate dehydrogenase cytochrome b560 subunit, mitochondrial-like [Maniola hyperantus]